MEVDGNKLFSTYEGVFAYRILETGKHDPISSDSLVLGVIYDPQGLSIFLSKHGHTVQDPLRNEPGQRLFETIVEKGASPLKVGRTGFIIPTESEAIFLKMPSEQAAAGLQLQISKALKGNDTSLFAVRTEESSALQYFQFYGYLSQQQNMMQDYIRTATYQKAIISNLKDFQDKVILDVGAGSGILSFFAIQAGAKRVYAVEASSMAMHAQTLAAANGLSSRLVVVPGKIEEVELPEKVDAIISEPMGYMLYNERMLETYLHAKKWLKPDGKMFPTKGDLHVTPFTDESLYMEQCTKANFWQQNCFHGVDLGSLRNAAMKEYFRQPVVDTFDIRICMAKSVKHTVDFLTASEFDLHRLDIPLDFEITESGLVHGLAFWFDVLFDGSSSPVWLSTSPTEPLTHWYQVRCLIEKPFFVRQGQKLTGRVQLLSNKRQSYDVLIELDTEGGKISNTLDLKNPYFRYTGQPPQPPPGHHNTTTAPSDKIWAAVDTNGVVNGVQTVQMNGTASIVDGVGTLVEMPQGVMGVLPGIPGALPQQMQTNASVTHYTTVPVLGDFVTAGQPQNVLLSNSNVSVLPHNLNWSH